MFDKTFYTSPYYIFLIRECNNQYDASKKWSTTTRACHLVHIRESRIRQSVSNNSGNEGGCSRRVWLADRSFMNRVISRRAFDISRDICGVRSSPFLICRHYAYLTTLVISLQNWLDWEHSRLLRKLMSSSSIFLCDFMALQINSIDVIPLRSTALTKGFDRPLRMDRRGLIYDHDKERIAKSRKTMHRSLV